MDTMYPPEFPGSGTIRIFYTTHKGQHIMRAVPTLAKAAEAIESLWKARIEAEAKEDGRVIGAVWYLDGELTWFCETEEV